MKLWPLLPWYSGRFGLGLASLSVLSPVHAGTIAGPPLLTLINHLMPLLPESEFPIPASYISEAPYLPLLGTGSKQDKHFQAG